MGTNFGAPLRWAQDKFKEQPRADLLFITDGVCEIEEHQKMEFIHAKNWSEARCYSVLIGSDATETVRQFSDKVFCLAGTLSGRDGGQILAEI